MMDQFGSLDPETSTYCSLADMIGDARRVHRNFDYAPFLRAARGALKLSQAELARQCKMSEATVRRHEQHFPPATESLEKIIRFFEHKYVEFVLPSEANCHMAGIRWMAGYAA